MSPSNDAPSNASDNRQRRLTGGDIATIVVIYATAGSLWILLSDALLLFTDDAASAALLSVFKGLGFVAVTSLLLYLVLHRFRTGHAAGRVAANNRFERLVYGIMILAALAIIAAGFGRVRAIVLSEQAQETQRLAAVAGRELQDIENWLDAHRREATLLAGLVAAAAGDDDAGALAARVLGPLLTDPAARDLLLVTPDSRVAWSASGSTGAPVGDDVLARALSRNEALSNPTRTHLDFIAPAHPVGAVVLRLDAGAMRRFAGDAAAVYGDSARVYLLGPAGERPVDLGGDAPGAAPAIAASATVPTTPVEGVDGAGREVVSVALPVGRTDGWRLVVEVHRERLVSRLSRELSWIAGGLSVALILPLATGLLLTQRRRLRLMELVDRQRDERVALVRHYDTLVQKARDMILLIDDEDRIVDANESAREAYGYTLEEMQRMTIRDLVAPDERPNVASRRDLAGEPGGALYESRHRCRDGRVMPVEVSARSVTIEGRRYRQALVRDISRRHHSQVRIERLTRLHRALSDCNQAIIRSRNRDTLFTEVCRALVETGNLGMAWVGVSERHGDRVIPVAVHGEDGAAYTGRLNISLDAAHARGRGPTAICMRDDRVVWSGAHGDDDDSRWCARAALPIHERGRVAASLNVYADHADGFADDEREILETLAADLSHALDYLATLKALRESEQRWGFALEGSAEGVWDRHIDTDEVFFSNLWKHMLGYTEGDVGTRRSEWHKRVHPDDLPGVEQAVDAHLHGGTEYYSAEYRMRSSDGKYIWIHDRGKVIDWDDAGQPLRMIGTHTDVTERKLIEERLREQARILEESQSIAHVGSWQYDPSRGTFTVSTQAHRIHGTDPDQFAGTCEAFLSLVHEEDRGALARWLEALAAGRQPGEIEYHVGDGARQVYARGVADTVDGRVSRIAGTVQDVTEWRATENRMQEQLDELRRWYGITLDREDRIMALKEEVNHLLQRLGEAPRYQGMETAS